MRPGNSIASFRYLDWNSIETIQVADGSKLWKQEVLEHIANCDGESGKSKRTFRAARDVTAHTRQLLNSDFRFERFPEIPREHFEILSNHRLFSVDDDLTVYRDTFKRNQTFFTILQNIKDMGYPLNSPESFLIVLKQFDPHLAEEFNRFVALFDDQDVSFQEIIGNLSEHFIQLLGKSYYQFDMQGIHTYLSETFYRTIQNGVNFSEFIDINSKGHRSFRDELLLNAISIYALAHLRQGLLPAQLVSGNRRALQTTKNAFNVFIHQFQGTMDEQYTKVQNAQKENAKLQKVLQESHVEIHDLLTICPQTEDDQYNYRGILLVNILYLHQMGKINIRKPYFSHLLDKMFPWITDEMKTYLIGTIQQ
jgi:hypothetical protein